MQPLMWKRLGKVAQSFSLTNAQKVVVMQEVDETDEEVKDKTSRWKAGELVRGIQGAYEGGELIIIHARLVAARSREQSDE